MRRLYAAPPRDDGNSWGFPAMGTLPITCKPQDAIPRFNKPELRKAETKWKNSGSIVEIYFRFVSTVFPLCFRFISA